MGPIESESKHGLEQYIAVELVDGMEELARRIAREEIATLAGKALRRTQDLEFTRSPDRNLAMEVANEQMAQFWGEVLAEYGDAVIKDGDETVGVMLPDER